MSAQTQISKLESHAAQLEKIIADLDAEAIHLEHEMERGGGSAAAAIDRALDGEADAADMTLNDDLTGRHRVITARVEEAIQRSVDAARKLANARAEALNEQAEAKRAEAAERQRKLAELLAPAVEFEGVEFMPLSTAAGGNRLIPARTPRTEVLLAEAEELDRQAAAERHGVSAIGNVGRGKRIADTPEQLGEMMPAGGPPRHAARAWARSVTATRGRDARFRGADGFFHIFELHFDGATINESQSSYRPDVSRRVA